MSFENRDLIAELPHLRRFSIHLTKENTGSEDLVQECLCRALAKRDSFKSGTNLRSWLFTILHNFYIDTFRKKSNLLLQSAGEGELEKLSVQPSQHQHIYLSEFFASMETLPREQKRVLNLVSVEGYSYQEAADKTGVPIGTIRSRVSRARSSLKSDHKLELQSA